MFVFPHHRCLESFRFIISNPSDGTLCQSYFIYCIFSKSISEETLFILNFKIMIERYFHLPNFDD